jgi:hypothetical protein
MGGRLTNRSTFAGTATQVREMLDQGRKFGGEFFILVFSAFAGHFENMSCMLRQSNPPQPTIVVVVCAWTLTTRPAPVREKTERSAGEIQASSPAPMRSCSSSSSNLAARK